MTITSGTGGTAVIYMISATKFVAVSQNDPNPAILDFELSSVSCFLLSFFASLNPASVAGGIPHGHSDVKRASSHRWRASGAFEYKRAASVPPSVTIAAGATSATFVVSTSAVASSTTSPSPRFTVALPYCLAHGDACTSSPPTLSSLSLNPTSVAVEIPPPHSNVKRAAPQVVRK